MATKSKTNKSKPKTGCANRLKSFFRSTSGVLVGAVLFVVIMLSFNALVAGENLEFFLGLNALEMVVAILVIWIILLRRRSE